MPPRARHLVLAEVWGYSLPVYRLFILSLHNTGFRGDIKLLAPPNKTRPEVVTWLAAHEIELVTLAASEWHSSDRFYQYSALCSGGYAWCLAADFRDTFFQRDPFEPIRRMVRTLPHADVPDLVLPAEYRLLHNDTFNAGMLSMCYGKRILPRLPRDAPVICSGVLLGNAAAFAALPAALVALAHRCPFDKMSDQAALNVLVHLHRRDLVHNATGRPIKVALEAAGTGFTATIGRFKGRDLADAFARGHIRDGIVLNDDGTPVPVVHQWDRLLFWKDKRKNHVCYSGLQPRTGLFESAYEVVDRPCPPGHVRYAAIDRVLQITDR